VAEKADYVINIMVVLIIFPLMLQTVINFTMLSIKERRVAGVYYYYYYFFFIRHEIF